MQIRISVCLLHRGTEKLIEYRTYLQALPYFGSLRLCIYDVLLRSMLIVWLLSVLFQFKVPGRAQYIRVLFLVVDSPFKSSFSGNYSCFRCGGFVYSFFMGFWRALEKIMEFYVSGFLVLGMHAAYIRPGGVVFVLFAAGFLCLWCGEFFDSIFSPPLGYWRSYYLIIVFGKQRLVDIRCCFFCRCAVFRF